MGEQRLPAESSAPFVCRPRPFERPLLLRHALVAAAAAAALRLALDSGCGCARRQATMTTTTRWRASLWLLLAVGPFVGSASSASFGSDQISSLSLLQSICFFS